MKMLNSIIKVFAIASIFNISIGKAQVQPNTYLVDNVFIVNSTWGEWIPVDHFDKLDYRIRQYPVTEIENTYRCEVEFRNRYPERIVFSFEVVQSNNDEELYPTDFFISKGKVLDAQTTDDFASIYTLNYASNISVSVKEVKFND